MATETTRDTETTPADTDTAGTDGAGTESTTTATTEPATTGADEKTGEKSGDTVTGKAAEPVKAAETTGTGAAAAATSGGLVAGAGAVVGAALGLVSLTGTQLTDMLRDRQSLIGQIEAATGLPGNQIEAFYGAPWHTAALANGVFAILAVIVAGAIAFGPAARPGAAAWARPVALGGLVLGVLGLLVAGGMYLDVFAAQPVLPAMPGMPGMGG
ncbi:MULTISPECIES: hypothetical protein [unclassified Pseudonocardia]|uniref:hypothetical protein n=1 Tax=unclassified Pseudonocardia TaxID=2619320 RepID=UPI00094AC2CB|nr:hypothetical protein [Pseudonocardia sp. Ae707_Ps1]OLM17624.1 putative integral membrane protein [Pseudonocardia sp. Ae707_Ps1]